MAGTPIAGEKVVIFIEDLDFNSPNSESMQTKIAKAALFAQNVTEYRENFVYNGYFRSNSNSDISEKFVVTERSTITKYIMNIGNTGSGTANSLNAKIYDSTGAFVNNLFSVSPSIFSASPRERTYIGKNIPSATLYSGNISGLTTNHGTLNLTILEKDWFLVGNVSGNAPNALNAKLELTLQRLE